MALRVRVCTLDEVIDGALCAFAVPGVLWPVIVTRVDGELVAVPGVCPHEDVGLAGEGHPDRETTRARLGWAHATSLLDLAVKFRSAWQATPPT